MFETGDRVRLIDSPNENIIPNGAEGIVVSTDVEYYCPMDDPGDVWVVFDGFQMPGGEIFEITSKLIGYKDNCPQQNAMDCRNEELELVSTIEEISDGVGN